MEGQHIHHCVTHHVVRVTGRQAGWLADSTVAAAATPAAGGLALCRTSDSVNSPALCPAVCVPLSISAPLTVFICGAGAIGR